MLIAYKECLESKYWLNLMKESDYIDDKVYDKLFFNVDEIGKILFKILKTSGRIKTKDQGTVIREQLKATDNCISE